MTRDKSRRVSCQYLTCRRLYFCERSVLINGAMTCDVFAIGVQLSSVVLFNSEALKL